MVTVRVEIGVRGHVMVRASKLFRGRVSLAL